MTSSEAMRLTMLAAMETNHDLAVRHLREAIAVDNENVLARFQLATILGSRGLHALAVDVLRGATAGAGKHDAGVRFLLARQLHLAGDPAAVEEYEAALILDPACEKAHLYLAQLLAADPAQDEEKVQEHAERAIRLRPSTSMVPEGEFVSAYEAAFGPDAVVRTSEGPDPMALMTLDEVVLVHPEVARLLEEVGISCVECAGYSHATLHEAAAGVGTDLPSLLRRIAALRERAVS